MTKPALVFDCTELFNNPVETGIQRVVRRLLRHWPATGPTLHVARFDPAHGLIRISEAALEVLQESHDGSSGESIRHLRARLIELSPIQQPDLPAQAPVLLPEVFWEPERTAFYQKLLNARGRPILVLAYDFLPFLEPGLFTIRTGASLMGYLRIVTAATDVAFISEKTRRDYTGRVMRDPAPDNAGPVFCLGSDGLTAPRQTWHAGRDSFVCIGTIEPRKKQELVIRCFQELWREGYQARLVLVGHHSALALPPGLVDALDHPNFTWLRSASDEQLAEAMQSARATIYAPESEGFGLPPVESLHVGVPVIAYAGLPCLEGVKGGGQVRLPEVTAASLKAAVLSLMDDANARQLWKQAGALKLPGWATFSQNVADWCTGSQTRTRHPGKARRR